jgi:hypothetical protein
VLRVNFNVSQNNLRIVERRVLGILIEIKEKIINRKPTYCGIRRFKFNQRGNAGSIRGTFPDSTLLSEIFVL